MNKNIYNFEKYSPPEISEKTLSKELARRETRRQIAVLAVSAAITLFCLIAFALIIANRFPVFAVFCVVSVCVSLCVAGVVSVMFFKRKEKFKYCA